MADLRQAILALTNEAKGKVDERLIDSVLSQMPANFAAEDLVAMGLRRKYVKAVATMAGMASAYREHASRHKTVGRAKSDPFFVTRVSDFDKAVEDGRATVKQYWPGGAPAEGAGEAMTERLGNLLAVIHGDGGHRALEVGTKQAALEAEKIVARLLSSAPEAREGEAVGVVYSLKADLNTAELPDGTLLYAHPAAPSADKLRIAVEALEGARDPLSTAKMWGKRKGGCDGAVDKIDRALWSIKQALAALEAEG